MYSYLNIGRGHHPGRINLKNHQIYKHKNPTCPAVKFKLAVFTVPANAWACSVTCDPCQPTKFEGYRGVFIYVGNGHLIHYSHAL